MSLLDCPSATLRHQLQHLRLPGGDDPAPRRIVHCSVEEHAAARRHDSQSSAVEAVSGRSQPSEWLAAVILERSGGGVQPTDGRPHRVVDKVGIGAARQLVSTGGLAPTAAHDCFCVAEKPSVATIDGPADPPGVGDF